jgi:acetoin utilization protein AcuB
MTKPIPPIHEHMTPTPQSIRADQTLSQAHLAMREYRVRHLPVLHEGKLVGIVSDRDLHLVEAFKGVDPRELTVEDAMTPRPYHVDPDTPLDEVTDAMAEHKYGCAVVMKKHKVVGIFTTTDACRALTEILRGRHAK